jgi:hypothetical protein
MNVAKSDANNASIPLCMDHPLLHDAERAKGVANPAESETRASKQWIVFISHELDSVEMGSPPTDLHVPNTRGMRRSFARKRIAFRMTRCSRKVPEGIWIETTGVRVLPSRLSMAPLWSSERRR